MDKQILINRLHRIEGQIRGIEGMIREDRDETQIIQQLEAARSAANQLVIALAEQKIARGDMEDLGFVLRLIKK